MKKTFDCIEMKNRIQSGLRQEYESRKAEFATFADFLTSTAAESQEINDFLKKMASSEKQRHSKHRQ